MLFKQKKKIKAEGNNQTLLHKRKMREPQIQRSYVKYLPKIFKNKNINIIKAIKPTNTNTATNIYIQVDKGYIITKIIFKRVGSVLQQSL